MKSKSTQKLKAGARKQPYQKPAAGRATDSGAKALGVQNPASSSSSASPPMTASAPSKPAFALETVREVYGEYFQKFYPGLTPRDDYDLLMLAQKRREGTPAELLKWVDERMQKDIESYGSREATMKRIQQLLDCTVGVTGRKPRPGRDIVHTCPIPDSKYSVRLWPGNAYVGEYCMDFVDTATQEAVNSPFEFELWAIPDPDAPWLSMPSGRLYSIERHFHKAQEKITPGAEKWVLRDGQTCLLKRPGKRDALFRVPVRKRPGAVQYDYDLLEFPKEV